MSDPYFVQTALPPLILGQKPEMPFEEVLWLYQTNLAENHLEKVHSLLEPIDLYNIRAFWLSEPLDSRGTLKEKELEEALALKQGLPEEIIEYLEEYESLSDRLRYFGALYAAAYRKQRKGSSFLDDYFSMEREVRLILTALRAKEKGRDFLQEFQFEDPYDPFLQQILAQKDMPDFIPPREYEDLKQLFMENKKDPYDLNRAVLRYRFEKIEEREEEIPFSLDALLGYFARLILVETFFYKEEEKAKIILEQLGEYE